MDKPILTKEDYEILKEHQRKGYKWIRKIGSEFTSKSIQFFEEEPTIHHYRGHQILDKPSSHTILAHNNFKFLKLSGLYYLPVLLDAHKEYEYIK